MIGAGKRDRRVTIQENRPTVRAGSGAKIDDWQTVATVWAAYEAPDPGSEPYTADQRVAFTNATFTMLFRSDLRLDPAKHRILFDGRTYNIVGVTEVQRRAEIKVLARARAEVGAPAA